MERLYAKRHEHIDFETSKFGCEACQAIVVAFRRSNLNGNVLALDTAAVTQAAAQCLDTAGLSGKRLGNQETNPGNIHWRLLSQTRKRRPNRPEKSVQVLVCGLSLHNLAGRSRRCEESRRRDWRR